MASVPSSQSKRRDRLERWEVGSEFDRQAVPAGPILPWPAANRLYGLAQHAVIATWDHLPAMPTRTLHVPDYYCPDVVESWRRAGIRIREYQDDPRWLEPDWSSLEPDRDDAVLALNYFGVRGQDGWERWRASHPQALLIEDHSHDPRSRWAQDSNADYAFASLRKTMPLSDGAILWSPRGRGLPGGPPRNGTSGSDLKLAAMILKREYLAGGDVDKDAFRALQIRGERDLLAGPASAITPWSRRMIEPGLPTIWRDRRRRNVRLLTSLISGTASMSPLFTTWPTGHCPFNLVLVFVNASTRDACQAFLFEQHIYPSIPWVQPSTAAERVRDLASVILNVPADQRYDASDMRRVAAALVAFDRSAQPSSTTQATYSSSRGAR